MVSLLPPSISLAAHFLGFHRFPPAILFPAFSDHCAVILNVSVPAISPPGPGLWKLNTSILQDDVYVQLITNFWLDWHSTQKNFSCLSEWWELGKVKIKELSIACCTRHCNEHRSQHALLVRLANHLKSQVDLGHLSCLGPYQST